MSIITAAIPVFNGADTIGRAIESIQNQSYSGELELLIVDDGSTDATREIVAKYARSDPRIRLVNHKKNRGRAAARNTLLSEAKGKYFGWLDADDEWLPLKLSIQLPFLQNQIDTVGHSNIIVVGSYLRKSVETEKIAFRNVPENYDLESIVKTFGSKEVYPLSQIFLAETETLQNIKYDERLNWAEDTDYLFHFFSAGGIMKGLTDETPILIYNHTMKQRGGRTIEESQRLLIEKHANLYKQFGLDPEYERLRRLKYYVSTAYLHDGDRYNYWRVMFEGAGAFPEEFGELLINRIEKAVAEIGTEQTKRVLSQLIEASSEDDALKALADKQINPNFFSNNGRTPGRASGQHTGKRSIFKRAIAAVLSKVGYTLQRNRPKR